MITTSEKNFITRAISLAFKYFVNVTLNIRHIPYQKQASVYSVGEFHYYWNSTMYCTAGWEFQTKLLQLSDEQPELTTAGLIWFSRGHVVAFHSNPTEPWKTNGGVAPERAGRKMQQLSKHKPRLPKYSFKKHTMGNKALKGKWVRKQGGFWHEPTTSIRSEIILESHKWHIPGSWFIIPLWPKRYFQIQTTSMYQQVVHPVLKAVITTVPLLEKSVTIFCTKGLSSNTKNILAKIATTAPWWSSWVALPH